MANGSPYDRFFNGQPPAPEWDGQPLLLMDDEQWMEVMLHGPHFNGCVVGPRPLGHQEQIVLYVNRIHTATIQEAAVACMKHAENVCEQWGYPFDPAEWTIAKLGPRSCS